MAKINLAFVCMETFEILPALSLGKFKSKAGITYRYVQFSFIRLGINISYGRRL